MVQRRVGNTTEENSDALVAISKACRQ